MSRVYKILTRAEWEAARAAGRFEGSAVDRQDGFIHFSTAAQLAASAAKHRAGQAGLVLLTVDAKALGPALRWEPARGGELFPHLHGSLPLGAVRRVDPLPLGPDGRHVFPAHVHPEGGGG